MSLEARYQHHDSEVIEEIQNLDRLEQIATAAGHGYAVLNPQLNTGWVHLEIDEANVRPSYDRHHIMTFSPDLVKALLFELSESRTALAGARSLLEQSGSEETLHEFDVLVQNIPQV